ncbi:hypothetical protein D3C81_1748530 [compost metagenome]|uniref:hypothetical protein n=1 Tax=Pseudomonas wadenswilerensis TaxID=1785161 RepID=UPI000E0F6784|nr:hypothetical protein [Pseudomonas wadenswilerensis]
MTDDRESALELALGMLLTTATLQGLDLKVFVDHTAALISKASQHFERGELGAMATAELHKAYADLLAAQQRSES